MTIEDLHARLLALQVEHARKKDINRIYRQARGNGLPAIAAKYGQATADECAALLKGASTRRKSPYPRDEFVRIAQRINRVEVRIRRVEARAEPRETIAGNGWCLRDDVVNDCTSLTFAVDINKQIKFALNGFRFKFSPLRGYHRERSREAWEAGLRIGRMVEAGATRIEDTQEQ